MFTHRDKPIHGAINRVGSFPAKWLTMMGMMVRKPLSVTAATLAMCCDDFWRIS